MYAFLIAGSSVALGPWLVAPLLLLVAMYASALGRPSREIACGRVVGYASFGLAGLVVALVSVAMMYPRGSYVAFGLATLWGVVFWLIVANTIAISIAMRTLAGVRWLGAVPVGITLALVVVICGIATFAAFGPLAVSGVAPPLLILPNTATDP